MSIRGRCCVRPPLFCHCRRAYSIPRAQSFPTIAHPYGDTDVETLSARLWEDAQRWAWIHISTLSELVSSITWPEETRYDEIRERLEAVADGLAVLVSDDFGQLQNNLGHWVGEAAENFSDEFYNRFTDVLERRKWLIQKLLAAAAVFKGTIRYSQHALMNAVTCTWELLREQLRLRRDADRGTELFRVFLTVAAGVTSVLTAYFSAGLSVTFGAAVIGQAFAAAAATLPDGAPSRTITGATAEELCNQLVDSIREIEHFVGAEYDNLHSQLGGISDLLDKPGVVIAVDRPLLVDGPSGEAFHHNTSSHYRGIIQ